MAFLSNFLSDMSKLASGTSSSTEALSGYAPQSISGAQSITNGNVVLKEYRHKDSNRFFYTSRINDQAAVEASPNIFEVTGSTITIKARYEAGLSAVHRLFNKTSFHFYTADDSEYNFELADPNYKDEGIEGYAIKISPRASCPNSPSVTYPVYRLLHSGNDKYRLVSDSTLRASLLSQGYIDQGVAFCATGVSSFATVTPPVTPPPIVNPPVVPVPVITYASCAFDNWTIAHGQTVTGYSASSGTVCSSQQVTCNNGALSHPNYFYGACTVTTPPIVVVPPVTQPPVAAKCTNVSSRVNASFSTEDGYKQFFSSGIMGTSAIYTIRVNVSSASTTAGRQQPVLLSHTEGRGAQRARRTVSISPCIGDFTSAEARIVSNNSMGSTDNVYINDAAGGTPNLTTGVWYINVKNVSCSATANCDMLIDWINF